MRHQYMYIYIYDPGIEEGRPYLSKRESKLTWWLDGGMRRVAPGIPTAFNNPTFT